MSIDKDKILEEQIFGIISEAGDAKSDVMLALKEIKKGDYKTAKELMKKASEKIEKAAKIHMELLNSTINDSSINFLVVHAEDHYSNASFAYSLVNELIDIFEAIDTREI